MNLLAAALAMAGLLGYVFVYTLWLKPLTPQNIVIGGAAGAVPPLVGWAAATGGLALEAFYPVRGRVLLDPAPLLGPLASDQGRLRANRGPDAAGGPRRGRDAPPDRHLLADSPRGQPASGPGGLFGALYAASALILGGAFCALALRLQARPSKPGALRLYLYSLAYLALLFAAMAADRVV